MESKTKSGFNVIQMVEIPEESLSSHILDALQGRSMYEDVDLDFHEEIYPGCVFSDIATEQYAMPQTSPLLLPESELKRLDELAEELEEYELVRINKV